MITKPGIYTDFDVLTYEQDPCPAPSLNQSLCRVLLDRSPAHARLQHPKLGLPTDTEDEPEKYDKAKAIGSAAHAMLLGRGKRIAVGQFNNWTSKDAKAFKADETAAGRIVILDKHFERAHAMVRALRSQVDAAGYPAAFQEGHGEVVAVSCENGLWLRTLIDWMVTPREVFDLKSSGLSCAPHAVEDRPSLLGWDIQAAMQERILDAVDPDGAGRRKFRFIPQENEEPYALTVVEISEWDLTMGRKKLAMAIDIWSRCMASGVWPGYPAETVLSKPRGYTETKWLEREVAHEERRARQPIAADHFMGG